MTPFFTLHVLQPSNQEIQLAGGVMLLVVEGIGNGLNLGGIEA